MYTIQHYLNDAIGIACRQLRTTKTAIRSIRRHKRLCEVRHICIYVAKQIVPYSNYELGHYFNREHNTICHAIKQVNNNKKLKDKAEWIIKLINEVLPNPFRGEHAD